MVSEDPKHSSRFFVTSKYGKNQRWVVELVVAPLAFLLGLSFDPIHSQICHVVFSLNTIWFLPPPPPPTVFGGQKRNRTLKTLAKSTLISGVFFEDWESLRLVHLLWQKRYDGQRKKLKHFKFCLHVGILPHPC